MREKLDRGELVNALLTEVGMAAGAYGDGDDLALDQLRASWERRAKELDGWHLALVEVALAVLGHHPGALSAGERRMMDFARQSRSAKGWLLGLSHQVEPDQLAPSCLWQEKLKALDDAGLVIPAGPGYVLTGRGHAARRRVQ